MTNTTNMSQNPLWLVLEDRVGGSVRRYALGTLPPWQALRSYDDDPVT